MDQSKLTSSVEDSKKAPLPKIKLSTNRFSTEFFVGLFTIIALACAAYLAVGLGGLELGKSDYYRIKAQFDNISGLKFGASVEIAGVQIGQVESVELDENKNYAIVNLKIINSVKLRDDDIASIRTKGIIGDKYIKVSRGASDIFIEPGETVTETESVVDIEDIIGKIVHNLGGDKEKKDEE